ncbi:hypothetical protein [Robertmurraya kyonggiensis]|uniref:Uncharacterized protein n=1 Tax=Robertmurraya kyonggiensis TaxID=1037680 RepID=A0A4U1DAK7_9BACI|nr:hypothetical protein [Robertmurraya kyonggiensis]TKC19572.1 hypothetical protein FA727_08535 [Robertmurraya kyonggiensis]
MLQVIDFNKQLKDQIWNLENRCSEMCKQMEEKYSSAFQNLDAHLTIDCLRTLKGKVAEQTNVFDPSYESFIEIGLEKDDEYYPNAYIPIWRCKSELFHEVGYMTKNNLSELERKVDQMLKEMLQERLEEIDE